MHTVGSFAEFKRLLPAGSENAHPGKQKAIEVYFGMGGVVKFDGGEGFPKLIYPSHKRLEEQIREAEEKLSALDKQLKDWRARREDLDTKKPSDHAAMLAEPLYWEHRAKLMSDPAYRATFDLVKPPIHLLHREKWKKRLKMFIRSKEYRIRLHEARLSVIGKKRAPMEDEVEARLDFNRQLTDTELKKLEEKRRILASRIDSMKALMRWVKSGR